MKIYRRRPNLTFIKWFNLQKPISQKLEDLFSAENGQHITWIIPQREVEVRKAFTLILGTTRLPFSVVLWNLGLPNLQRHGLEQAGIIRGGLLPRQEGTGVTNRVFEMVKVIWNRPCPRWVHPYALTEVCEDNTPMEPDGDPLEEHNPDLLSQRHLEFGYITLILDAV